MDYKIIFQFLYDIINLQFTQTILIGIVTIGGVWYTQRYERKRWDQQRKEEKEFWIIDKKINLIDDKISKCEYLLSNSRIVYQYMIDGTFRRDNFSKYFSELPLEIFNLLIEARHNEDNEERRKLIKKFYSDLGGYIIDQKCLKEDLIINEMKKLNNA